MDILVKSQITLITKFLATHIANMRLDTKVAHDVCRQLCLAWERLRTDLALVFLLAAALMSPHDVGLQNGQLL